jgi:MFS family permease
MAILGGGHLLQALNERGPIMWPVIGEVQPWQLTFFGIGLAGLPLAAILATIREPARKTVHKGTREIPFREVLGFIRSNFRCHGALIAGFSLMIMLGYGSSAWWPAFFQRTYGWSFADIGTYFGLAVLIFGTAGALTGGWLSGWLRRRGHADANVRAALIGAALLLPASVLAPLSPTGTVALAFMAAINFCAGIPFGGGYAAIQEATPARIRAQVSAVFLLAINLIGVGLGPVAVGLITDKVFADPADLRYALSIAAIVVAPLSVLAIVWGLPAYRVAVERATDWDAVNA